MADINTKAIVGETFEDLSIAEMTLVQGSGDAEVAPLSTTLCISGALVTAAATGAFTMEVVKTIKGKCS